MTEPNEFETEQQRKMHSFLVNKVAEVLNAFEDEIDDGTDIADILNREWKREQEAVRRNNK